MRESFSSFIPPKVTAADSSGCIAMRCYECRLSSAETVLTGGFSGALLCTVAGDGVLDGTLNIKVASFGTTRHVCSRKREPLNAFFEMFSCGV